MLTNSYQLSEKLEQHCIDQGMLLDRVLYKPRTMSMNDAMKMLKLDQNALLAIPERFTRASAARGGSTILRNTQAMLRNGTLLKILVCVGHLNL